MAFNTAPEKPVNLWVPKTFAAGHDVVYGITASHRGDMYHVRGAMALDPKPLIIWGDKKSNQDLVEYLVKGVQVHFSKEHGENWQNWKFVTDMDFQKLTATTSPGHDFEQRPITIRSESDATTVIAQLVKTEGDRQKLREGVAHIDADVKEEATQQMIKSCAELFKSSGEFHRVLVLHRDSGTKGGAYPELDTSDGSLRQIAKAIERFPLGHERREAFRPVLAGNAHAVPGIAESIGQYWTKLPNIPKQTKRDIEAFFLLTAYNEKKFTMATGFRSGALDLITFLGVPTVSISLRQIVGEGRHGRIANNKLLQRINIQYNVPRHRATRFIKPRQAGVRPMGSPWWTFEPKEGHPNAEDKAEQQSAPREFYPYDEEVVEKGMYVAITQLLPNVKKPAVFVQPVQQSRVFLNTASRWTYYYSKDKGQGDYWEFTPHNQNGKLLDYHKKLMQLEEKDLADKKRLAGQTANEAREEFKEMEKEWKKIQKNDEPPKSDDPDKEKKKKKKKKKDGKDDDKKGEDDDDPNKGKKGKGQDGKGSEDGHGNDKGEGSSNSKGKGKGGEHHGDGDHHGDGKAGKGGDPAHTAPTTAPAPAPAPPPAPEPVPPPPAPAPTPAPAPKSGNGDEEGHAGRAGGGGPVRNPRIGGDEGGTEQEIDH